MRFSSFSEREQLPPVPVGAGASHNVPADLRRQVPARVQADPHGPQTGEHSLRHLRLGDLVQPEKGWLPMPSKDDSKFPRTVQGRAKEWALG